METYQSRIYNVSDFIEWEERNQLEIAPKFQRRAVWSLQAKSYLIDTIINGKPLPKIYIRATTDPKTKKTTREVVDGQQRISAILSFVKNGFRISKIHNEEFGGMTYSDLPEEVQEEFLQYALSVDLLMDMSDPDVLDIFARLNTYSVSLNRQEKINAKYFGYFKQLVYRLGGKYYNFWVENNIFTEHKITRMAEAELVSDILVACSDGIDSRKNAEKYYRKYEEQMDKRQIIEDHFSSTMNLIGNLFGNTLSTSNFRTVPNFYGVFLALYHMNYGIPRLDIGRAEITAESYPKIRNCLEDIDAILDLDPSDVPREYQAFVKSTRDATTDVPSRTANCKFIVQKMLEALE